MLNALNVSAKGPTETDEFVVQDDEESPKKKKTGRDRGRPRGRNDPSIDWEAIENAYVWGTTVKKREDGSYVREYPTFKSLAEKFKVAPSLVHYYAKRGKWLDRRLSVIKQTKEEFDQALAKSAARETVDALEVIELWLRKFRDNLNADKVRADNVNDLDKVLRLRAFLEGKGDSRVEHKVTVTLEALQERHAAQRARVIEAHGEVAGEIDKDAEERLLSGEQPMEPEDQDAHEGEV